MGFGPYKLLDVTEEGNALVLHLGNEYGQVLFKPRRLLSYRGTEEARRSAEGLKEAWVTTRTFNPAVYSPKEWWLSVHRYSQPIGTPQPESPAERHKVIELLGPGKTARTACQEDHCGSAISATPGFGHVHKIYGPPGTGKTSRLLELVEQALDCGVQPAKIGFFSYTNKATDEARQRMAKRFSRFNVEQDFPYFQTLHSLAYQSLRTRVAVISEQQARDFSEEVRIERPLMREGDDSSRVTRVKHPVLDASSTARAKKMPLNRYLEDLPETQRWPIHKWRGRPRSEWESPLDGVAIQACVDYDNRYEMHKRMLGVIDYTDMIERALRDGAALPALQLLLIDEAQDLTPLQWDLARVLIERADRCHVAGDDDQAICEPFGASAKDFVELPVGTGNEVVLETSRRVPAAVHEALYPLIQRLSRTFPYRKGKTWHPKAGSMRGKVSRFRDVGEFLQSGILGKYVDQSKDALLMFATNATLQNVSALLKNRGVSHFAAHELVGAGDPVVRLLSVWGAKGGEAPLAALIVESKMDRKMLAGDPRLEYVAHTRAQEEYCLVGFGSPAAAAPQPRMPAPSRVTPSPPASSGGLSPQSLELLKQKFGKSG